ncbi:hypothetical protein TARUN_3219 [Trichoderma arundinaceum]|uniref:Uncharacterized protein n=1 Tax=Trichoderma arundinaceum TaxID=490622 RepID=A0A395NSM9_TRIAR|nr:hypothetical protein TARUN_3219 [Trichoderma arundinaceum]
MKKDEIPPVPPTPDIPESIRSTITRTGLRFLQRMRSQPEIQPRGLSSSKLPQIATVFASNKAKSTTKLVKQPNRAKVPQDQTRDSFYLRTSSFPEASIRSSQYSLYSQHGPQTQSAENASVIGKQDGIAASQGEGSSSLKKPEIQYTMCEPRLSTMEYTRLYLVEEANAKKEKRLCELPPPKKVWLWGPRWEEFLVLPKIPSTIKRRFSLNFTDEEKKSMTLESLGGGHDSDADSVETVKGTTSVPAKPPRLSLNLETMAATLTSLMNLASLGSDKASPSTGKVQPLDVTDSSAKENLGQSYVAAADATQICASTIDKAQSLRLTSSVSSMSMNEDEDDLYSDDRHLWPSPISQRSMRLTSVSPLDEEATDLVHNDTQIIENTTPQLSDETFETSSIYSDDSAKTAVFVGDDSKEAEDIPQTPEITRRREQITTSEETSPPRPGLPFSYSCASFNSLSSDRSPLTHFPISAEQRSRTTTEDIVKGVITQSGGRLRAEDARQVQLVESGQQTEIQASSADIWHADEYMEPDLQPAPLNLSKKPSVARPRDAPPEIPARAMINPSALDHIQPFKSTSKPGKFVRDTAEKYHEKIKSYESGFVPLPGSLLYEADKNTDIIRIPRSLSNSSKSSSSISAIITPSRSGSGPAKEANGSTRRSEKATDEPKPFRYTNELYGIPGVEATNDAYQPQPGKSSPTLSDLDEFFGVGPYEQAYLQKHPEAVKPFVLPPKVLESPESPVFTDPTYTTPMLRRRDMSIQQHRAIPQNIAQRVMERRPNTSVNVSSFALHRAQGNKATILPVIEGRSQSRANSAARDMDMSQHKDYEDSISEEHMPQHTFLDDVHRFSLQRYDISARRPSTHARPSTYLESPSPTPPAEYVVAEGRKLTNTPATTLGNLFRKRNRSRTVNQQEAPKTQQVPTTPTNLLPSPTPPAEQSLAHWQPVSEQQEQNAPCSSSWISAEDENLFEKQLRINYFREQAARALTGEIDQPRPYPRGSGGTSRGTVGSEDGGHENVQRRTKASAPDGRTPGGQISKPITGMMDTWINQGLPSPAPTTPLPPVPHRPSGRQISGMRSAPRPSAVSSAGTSTGLLTGAGHTTAQPGAGGQAPSHRDRNPLGLRVETAAWKLRKANKEVLRSGRNVSSPHGGGSNSHGQK